MQHYIGSNCPGGLFLETVPVGGLYYNSIIEVA
jgi:hypothetical protein